MPCRKSPHLRLSFSILICILFSLTVSLKLTDAQASALGKNKVGKILNGLSQLTDFQAEQLGNIYDLNLNGLKKITDQQAESLGRCKLLGLSGLTKLSEAAAAHLSNVSMLRLEGINQLSESQAKHLSRCLLYIGPRSS